MRVHPRWLNWPNSGFLGLATAPRWAVWWQPAALPEALRQDRRLAGRPRVRARQETSQECALRCRVQDLSRPSAPCTGVRLVATPTIGPTCRRGSLKTCERNCFTNALTRRSRVGC